ncbi:MAG: hypothetical protein ABJZ55_20440 [Fuerstiella sp.]
MAEEQAVDSSGGFFDQSAGVETADQPTAAEAKLQKQKADAKNKVHKSRRARGVVVQKRTVLMGDGKVAEMPKEDQPNWLTGDAADPDVGQKES